MKKHLRSCLIPTDLWNDESLTKLLSSVHEDQSSDDVSRHKVKVAKESGQDPGDVGKWILQVTVKHSSSRRATQTILTGVSRHFTELCGNVLKYMLSYFFKLVFHCFIVWTCFFWLAKMFTFIKPTRLLANNFIRDFLHLVWIILCICQQTFCIKCLFIVFYSFHQRF